MWMVAPTDFIEWQFYETRENVCFYHFWSIFFKCAKLNWLANLPFVPIQTRIQWQCPNQAKMKDQKRCIFLEMQKIANTKPPNQVNLFQLPTDWFRHAACYSNFHCVLGKYVFKWWKHTIDARSECGQIIYTPLEFYLHWKRIV